MSLSSIWSCQLKSHLQLLRFGICRCKIHCAATRDESQDHNTPVVKSVNIRLGLFDQKVRSSTKLQANKSEIHELPGVQTCNILNDVSDIRDIARLVTIFVFDIETTGFNRRNDRIIEFALQDLVGGKNSTFQTLVNPERYIPNSDIHGISYHMVNRPDVPRIITRSTRSSPLVLIGRWKDLVPILLSYVRSRQKLGGPVLWVSHNGRRFDVPFIIKEFSRCSADIPQDWLFVDTLPLARQLVKPDGSKLSSSTLQSLREHYGIPLQGSAHRAMSDVNSLALILQRITFDLKLPVSGLLEKSFKASDITQVSS